MPKFRIHHLTEYTFSREVVPGPHRLRIRPRAGHDIRIESSSLMIFPAHTVKWRHDLYGNSEAVATFHTPTSRLRFESTITLQHYESAPLDFTVEPRAALYPFAIDADEHLALTPYLTTCYPNDNAHNRDWLAQFWHPGQTVETYTLLDRINKCIARTLVYQRREEPGVQRPSETLSRGSGSCRDFATLFMESARHFGIPARFVSGYVHCPENTRGHGSTHAWCEVYLPGAGWKSFDSTSGLTVGDTHIATAVSRHPEDIPPISGTVRGPAGTNSHMLVQVEVSAV
ncbi:MAG: transglutaminase family protein [Candidatus Methylacidiphilales bacterium]|nr:transglutaminase family protein [Candidatus Methylacidiphilales bacterium]